MASSIQANHGFRFPKIEEGGYLKFLRTPHHESDRSKGIREFAVEFELKPILPSEHCLLVYYESLNKGTRMSLSTENDQLVYR